MGTRAFTWIFIGDGCGLQALERTHANHHYSCPPCSEYCGVTCLRGAKGSHAAVSSLKELLVVDFVLPPFAASNEASKALQKHCHAVPRISHGCWEISTVRNWPDNVKNGGGLSNLTRCYDNEHQHYREWTTNPYLRGQVWRGVPAYQPIHTVNFLDLESAPFGLFCKAMSICWDPHLAAPCWKSQPWTSGAAASTAESLIRHSDENDWYAALNALLLWAWLNPKSLHGCSQMGA